MGVFNMSYSWGRLKTFSQAMNAKSIAVTVLSCALALGFAARAARGQTQQAAFLSVDDIRPGMKGIGRTVFEGTTIAEFQVEMLGVLKNFGPKQDLILARLSGGPLERTGVIQGMSGSPVYVDNRLVGAIAYAFPFSKEPIAGIQPIGQMLSILSPSIPSPLAAPAGRAAANAPGLAASCNGVVLNLR